MKIYYSVLKVVFCCLFFVGGFTSFVDAKEVDDSRIYYQIVEKKINNLKDYINKKPTEHSSVDEVIADVYDSVRVAKNCDANVDDLKILIPDLVTKAFRVNAERMLDCLEKYSNKKPSGYVSAFVILENVNKALFAAKNARADVEDLEARMPDLIKKVFRVDAEEGIANLEECTNKDLTKCYMDSRSIYKVCKAIVSAKSAGVETSDLEARFPELLMRLMREE